MGKSPVKGNSENRNSMGGTGKTQVIKALISMFEQRHENHRFIVLAPKA